MPDVWVKCQCPAGSSQSTRWRTVYGDCRRLCRGCSRACGGAPGRSPCHPGEREKQEAPLTIAVCAGLKLHSVIRTAWEAQCTINYSWLLASLNVTSKNTHTPPTTGRSGGKPNGGRPLHHSYPQTLNPNIKSPSATGWFLSGKARLGARWVGIATAE